MTDDLTPEQRRQEQIIQEGYEQHDMPPDRDDMVAAYRDIAPERSGRSGVDDAAADQQIDRRRDRLRRNRGRAADQE